MHCFNCNILITTCLMGVITAAAPAAVVDDFESYTPGLFPSANWIYPAGDGSSLTDVAGQSIDVQSNANNIAGQHLQFDTTYNADSVTRLLPVALVNDGDYIQVATKIVVGRTLASMFLTSNLYAGGHGALAPQPPIAIGLSSEPGAEAFTTQHNGVFDSDFRIAGATPSLDTWYILRVTMRDNEGAAGVIDSYDIEIFDDSLTPLASQSGITFFGGEGEITGIALRSYEQSGTSNAVALFDEITYVLAPQQLTGDLDGDGFVGITDLNIVLGNWNQNVTAGDPLVGDPTGDGFVGIEDLNEVLGNWNAGTPPGVDSVNIVPEPGTAALIGTGVLCLCRNRWRDMRSVVNQ